MSIIKVKCTDQVLAFENTPVIASGGLLVNFVQFSFCNQWTGFARTAVFWRDEGEPYGQLLDAADACEVPPEVTADDGTIFFGVFGVGANGEQRTSNVLTYSIEKGAITTDLKPSDPTPDIYNQLLAQYAELKGTTFAAGNVGISAAAAEALGLEGADPTVEDALLALNNQGGNGEGGTTEGAVLYNAEQALTDEQKEQARINIGAASSAAELDGGVVLYDTVQDLPETQQARARSNIGAAAEEDLETLQAAVEAMQVEATVVNLSAWDSGSFTVTMDGVEYEGSVEFDADGRPSSVTLNGHTLTLTLPEVE